MTIDGISESDSSMFDYRSQESSFGTLGEREVILLNVPRLEAAAVVDKVASKGKPSNYRTCNMSRISNVGLDVNVNTKDGTDFSVGFNVSLDTEKNKNKDRESDTGYQNQKPRRDPPASRGKDSGKDRK